MNRKMPPAPGKPGVGGDLRLYEKLQEHGNAVGIFVILRNLVIVPDFFKFKFFIKPNSSRVSGQQNIFNPQMRLIQHLGSGDGKIDKFCADGPAGMVLLTAS